MPFKTTINYTDSESETETFNDYKKATSYVKNELEWENTIDVKVTNDFGTVLFHEKGAFTK